MVPMYFKYLILNNIGILLKFIGPVGRDTQKWYNTILYETYLATPNYSVLKLIFPYYTPTSN